MGFGEEGYQGAGEGDEEGSEVGRVEDCGNNGNVAGGGLFGWSRGWGS